MLGREHDVVESKLCFNRRLGHDVRYGLVDRFSYTRVPSPMIWRSDKAAARWGLSRSGRLSTARAGPGGRGHAVLLPLVMVGS